MKKLQFGRDALTLAVLTLITVLTWVGFDVYRALTKAEIPKILQKQIAPLDPKVNWETIKRLKRRETPSEEELKTVLIPKLTPSPEATPTGEATEGGEISE